MTLPTACVRGYKWDDCDDDFSDPLTQTTRREFGRGDFDPWPGRHRSKLENAAPISWRRQA